MIPQKKMWDYRRITNGLILMLWGMFLKLVIADRAAILVDAVFGNGKTLGAAALWTGAVGFSLQIYCDFAGYSTIAIGAARVLGFGLMENFNTPYFARSMKDFWSRWHISLSTWFKDYLYIPLGGNRCKRARRYFNLMITFLASGIWHGAGWTFVIWGGLHGLFRIIGDVLRPGKEKLARILKIKTASRGYKLLQTMITVFLAVLAWVFFRAVSVSEAFAYLRGMFTVSGFMDGIKDGIGINGTETIILAAALLILFAASLIKYNRHKDPDVWLEKQRLWVRWPVLLFLLFAILIFGIYGPEYSTQAFIYFQF